MGDTPNSVPDFARGLRGYLAVHCLSKASVARAYPCSHQWVSIVLGGRRHVSKRVMERMRGAVATALDERARGPRAASHQQGEGERHGC